MRLAEMIFNRPHLVHPGRAQVMLWALRERLGIADMPEPSHEVSAFFGRAARSGLYRIERDAAIIPVHGTLVNRGGWVGAQSGVTSYEGLAAQVREARDDDAVQRIVLDIDSPGGTVGGLSQLAELIRRTRDAKPVTAVVNDMAASAAYWLAAQADEIVISPTSMVGSIGVIYIHSDFSRALDATGITVTMITAGEHKADGNPYEPLPDDVRGDIQADLDAIWEMFIEAVHSGRPSLSAGSIKAMEARVYTGAAAIKAGLADRIGTLAEVLGIEETTMKKDGKTPEATAKENDADAKAQDAVVEDKCGGQAAEASQQQINADDLRKEGALAERERIHAIFSLDEAKGRTALALTIACKTDASPEDAKDILAAAPLGDDAPGMAKGDALGLELSDASSARGESPDAKWSKVLAKKYGK